MLWIAALRGINNESLVYRACGRTFAVLFQVSE